MWYSIRVYWDSMSWMCLWFFWSWYAIHKKERTWMCKMSWYWAKHKNLYTNVFGLRVLYFLPYFFILQKSSQRKGKYSSYSYFHYLFLDYITYIVIWSQLAYYNFIILWRTWCSCLSNESSIFNWLPSKRYEHCRTRDNNYGFIGHYKSPTSYLILHLLVCLLLCMAF